MNQWLSAVILRLRFLAEYRSDGNKHIGLDINQPAFTIGRVCRSTVVSVARKRETGGCVGDRYGQGGDVRLVQYLGSDGQTAVGQICADGKRVLPLNGINSTYDLAQSALAAGESLDQAVGRRLASEAVAYDSLLTQLRLLPPLTHPDSAHCLVSGTGLTHLGSASTRDAMHSLAATDEPSKLSDSMRMFRAGIEGGRPAPDQAGVQPEWFYKGHGDILVAPGAPLIWPSFALDGGEEPELVGLYVIGPDGTPWRLGFAIGNEFSDHVMERQNYLLLAHSKLRSCAIGPEVRTGYLPPDLRGHSRIRRGGEVVWERPFLTGEANMSHTLANLEYHHFKYAAHRRPGDVHLHFFGTATLSFADGVGVSPGDVFEIDLPELGAPLRNPLAQESTQFFAGAVRSL
jgi:hypothetical protein